MNVREQISVGFSAFRKFGRLLILIFLHVLMQVSGGFSMPLQIDTFERKLAKVIQ